MKTAEEWFEEHAESDDTTGHWYWLIDEDNIKQIQLDAIKEGMRRAANYLDKCPEKRSHMHYIKTEILTAAEQLTEKDL